MFLEKMRCKRRRNYKIKKKTLKKYPFFYFFFFIITVFSLYFGRKKIDDFPKFKTGLKQKFCSIQRFPIFD